MVNEVKLKMTAAIYYGKSAQEWVTHLCTCGTLVWKICTTEGTVTCELTCKFSNEEFEVQGSGNTEEDAKENCSEKLLFQFLDITKPKLFALSRDDLKLDLSESEYMHPLPLEREAGVSSQAFINAISDEVLEAEEAGFDKKNYIGALQEECQSRGWQFPDYQEIDRSGPPHMPLFTFKCTVGSVEKFAKKSNKKDAKSMAAYKVLEKLKAIQFNIDSVNDALNQETQQASSVPMDDALDEVVGKMRHLTLLEPCSLREDFITKYYDLIQAFVSLDHNEDQKRHSLFILDWICQKAGIEHVLYEPIVYLNENEGNFHSISKIKVPFNNYTPSIILVEGIGMTKMEAVQECTLASLRMLIE